MAVPMERLKVWVRYVKPWGPRWRRWRIVSSSGPAAVEFPELSSASRTCLGVKGGKERSRGNLPIRRWSRRADGSR